MKFPRDDRVAAEATRLGLANVAVACAHGEAVRFLRLAAAIVGITSCLTAATTTTTTVPRAKAPKTHTLFMGADISVERDGELYRVQDVQGDSFVIVVKGERVLVPMRRDPVYLKISESLKVTKASATLDKLRGERAYTPATDPHRRFAAETGSALGAAAAVDLATYNVGNAQAGLAAAQSAQANNPQADLSGQIATAQQNLSSASMTLDSASSFASSNLANPGYYAGVLQEELARGLYDALEVSFEISAEKPLENPYIVIVTRFRQQEGRPGSSRNWVYAQALAAVDQKPRKIHVLRGGFPPAFDLESYQVHLYDRGVEIATNASRKRVELTADEAFQYSVIEYVSRHKGATLGARARKSDLPADVAARLPADQANRTYYVKVTKDGRASGVFLDEQCAQKLNDVEIEAVLQGLRFNPALEKGKPIEGVAAVNLAQLAL